MAKIQTNGNGSIYLNQSNQVLLGYDMSDDRVIATGTTTARTLANRFADVINVKDFGAVGDGVTDDTNAIQAAINSSHHANTGIKDIIFFPAGKYKVTTITISNGQSVILSNPTLISESTALIINNAYEGTIIEYGKIKAKDCGIWIQRGKAVHIEHTRIDITHEYADSTEVYGIRLGGVQDLYAGNENIISDCSIYSNKYIESYGLYVNCDDCQFNNIIIYNFKYGIRDAAGSNSYSQIHGWINGYTEGTQQELEDSLRGSALFYTYRDITIQSAYADSYQYAIYCTDSSGLYQHKIDGLLIFHGSGWPSNLNIYAIRTGSGIPYVENSFLISNLDISNKSEANQYYCDNGVYYLHSFYKNNPSNSDVGSMPVYADVMLNNVGTGLGNEARLYAVKEDRKTSTGYMGFGSWSSGAYYWLLHLNSSDNFTAQEITFQQNSSGSALKIPTVLPHADNVYNIGSSSARWKEIFCANATINTSDERLKQQISDIPDKVLDIWSEINFCQFKFNDAVSKKGEKARIHMGLIAQRIKDKFEEHNINPFDYGLLCYDEWEAEEEEKDKDGNIIQPAIEAGNRYSLRYEECLCMEAAYQRRRADRIEARLTALEVKLSA